MKLWHLALLGGIAYFVFRPRPPVAAAQQIPERLRAAQAEIERERQATECNAQCYARYSRGETDKAQLTLCVRACG